MRRIWIKLFICFLLITFVTVTSVGLFLKYSFQDKFAEYVKANLTQKHQNLINYVEVSLYNHVNLHDLFLNLAHFSAMESVRVQIMHPTGEILFDSIYSETMMAPFRERKVTSPKAYQTEKQITANEITFMVRVISQVSEGLWSPSDITFKAAINYSLIGSVAIALLFAVLFSIFTSSMITSPLTTLKNAALLISRGDWKTRVKIKTRDELEELGDSFNKMALDLQHLEELRSKMTADLAHELRNPLMSIQNYIEGMQDGVIEPDKAHLEDLHDEVQRLTRLIEDLQKLARVEGRRQIEPTALYLPTEFTPYFQRYKLDYGKKLIEFSWEIEEVEGSMDKFIVKEILQNLLDNAYKYTHEGGKVFCVLKKEHLDGKNGLEITVTDTGIGISEKDLPYIFERFYRADPSRARATGGTGIGLAITKELVELVDGTISVESQLEKGTVFTVFIPFVK